MPVLQQPEAYIGRVGKLFDTDGRLSNEATRDLLKKFIEAFAGWIKLNLGKQ